MPARSRLSPTARREQLLDHGVALFAAHRYEDVWIEQVAELAGVSRGLLYHYFANKSAFFAALLEREAGRLAVSSNRDGDLGDDLVEELIMAIDDLLTYARSNPDSMRVLARATESADPHIRAIIAQDLLAYEQRILRVLNPSDGVHDLFRITVRGWLVFLRSMSFSWLDLPALDRTEVRNICADTLLSALLALPPAAKPQRLAELRPRDP